jgi:excinuclease ABC subunit C
MSEPQPPSKTETTNAATPDVAAAPVVTGAEVIQGYLKDLPQRPGVYRMIDAAGEVLYVGKARSLKARVTNYARPTGLSNRILRMVMATASMEFVTVRTEAEALLLEANLIKRLRPRFNVLMRDDKSFPYILIRRDTDAPQILKHRGARGAKGDYFGPFASATAVVRTVNMLQRAFLLRTCSDSVFDGRTRPCLLYQIKRCAGPCTGEISAPDYAKLVDDATAFLRGESQNVRRMYQGMMEDAAAKQDYEQAAKFRNRLWALAHVTADQVINPDGIEEADVFAAHQEGGQTCIQVFFFRTGQNWGNRAYYPKADKAIELGEVLESFIAQFYDDKPVPRLILASHPPDNCALLAEALCTKAGYKVEIRVPQRGAKSDMIDHAVQNAREALGRKLAETSSQRRLLEGLQERFGLKRLPRRIEVYDNSHIQGAHAVGGMIVAGPEGFVKGQYRKFNIKTVGLTPGDDYGMMREVLTRRFKRLALPDADTADASLVETAENAEPFSVPLIEGESPPGDTTRLAKPAPPPRAQRGADAIAFGMLRADTMAASDQVDPDIATDAETDEDNEATEPMMIDEPFPDRPDLVLIDGGLGQLAVARDVLAELGVTDIALVGVAKGPDRDAGREHFHFPGRPAPLMLEPRDPVLYFVQRLRDEAHRFAIGAHRAKRSKAIGVNPLDEIEGIGPTRKRALLAHFGSAKSTSRAGVEDLKAVKGISAEMAQKIYDFFHDKRS